MMLFLSIILGAAIPVGINGATFFVLRRTVVRDPSSMIKANITAFMVRVVLYAAAVALVAILLRLNYTAFILSFAAVFVLLHLAEALYFRRLFRHHNST